MTEERSYPLDIRGEMSPDLSRWLWLVKWLLAIPHFIVLIFLSLAAFVLWVIAWWAILFTARYPRGMFNYIVGVMRWWWRVSFYAFYPLATDRYPPFSLKSNDNYPADLYVEYPVCGIPGAPLTSQGHLQVVAARNPALFGRNALRRHAGAPAKRH